MVEIELVQEFEVCLIAFLNYGVQLSVQNKVYKRTIDVVFHQACHL